MNYTKNTVFSILILALLIISCSKNASSISKNDLLINNNCEEPCFWNITPGLTIKNDAEMNLVHDLNQKKCTNIDRSSTGGVKAIYCESLALFYTEEDIVQSIIYYPSEPISLEKIIDLYGLPDCYTTVGSETENNGPLDIYLFFDKFYLTVYFPEGIKPAYKLEEKTFIKSLEFSEEKQFTEIEFSCLPWKGYGNY